MHINRVEIAGVPPLDGEEVFLHCNERVNLFIGPNVSGKSTILRAMHGLNSQEVACTDEVMVMRSPYLHDDDDTQSLFCFLWPSDDWPRNTRESEFIWDALPVLYIPATRMSLRGRDIFNFNQITDKVEYHGTDAPLKDLFDTDSGIFYGQYVELAIDRLRKEMAPSPPSPEKRTADWTPARMNINRSQQNQFRKALQVGYSCAKRICPEVMHDDAPHPFVELDEEREISDTGRVVHYSMGIGTSDDITGEPLYAGALSSGTQGTPLCLCPGPQNGIRLWLDGGLGRKAGHPAD